jgi:hypothetical protein
MEDDTKQNNATKTQLKETKIIILKMEDDPNFLKMEDYIIKHNLN